MNNGKIKHSFSIFVIMLLVFSSFVNLMFHNPIIVKGDEPEGWIIDGDSVYINDSNVYLSATPHTIGSSGWVEFEVKNKVKTEWIDVTWGFNVSNIRPTNPQIWRNYTHNVKGIRNCSEHWNITINNVTGSENLGMENYSNYNVDYGNENNTKLFNITYNFGENGSVDMRNVIIAFLDKTIDGVNVTFHYFKTDREEYFYQKTFFDWDNLNLDWEVKDYDYQDMNRWYLLKNITLQKDKLYKVRAWMDVPFSGFNTTSGKYWWALKPHNETISEAISNNHFYYLDPWYSGSWEYYRMITIESDMVANGLKNFPLLINSTDTDMIGKCKSGGEDIVFIGHGNLSGDVFNHQIENWTAGGFDVWVNISEVITSGSDYSFGVFYGNTGASDSQNVTGVWDTDYLGVYHFCGEITDSTINDNDLTNPSAGWSINYTDGVVAECADFEFDVRDRLEDTAFHDYTQAGDDHMTITTWYNAEGLDDLGYRRYTGIFVGHGPVSLSVRLIARTDTDKTVQLSGQGTTGIKRPIEYGVWSHFSAQVTEGSSGEDYFYHDGELIGFNDGLAIDLTDMDTDDLDIGADTVNSRYFDGQMDEVRISKILRNSTWINVTYHCMNYTPGFITFGNEMTEGAMETEVNDLPQYWYDDVSTVDVTATATSGSPDNVTLWYRWSDDNSSWEGGEWAWDNNTVDDNTVDLDNTADVGTETSFSNAQDTPPMDSNVMTLEEADQGGAGVDEDLEVDGVTTDYTTWGTSGNSPWLDADDATNILSDNTNAQQRGWFRFPDTTGPSGSGYTVVLYVDFDAGDGDDDCNWNIDTTGDNTPEFSGTFTDPTTNIMNTGTISGFDTDTEINNARLRLDYIKDGGGGIMTVDYAYLDVTRSASTDYEADFEYKFESCTYNESFEELCFYTTTDAEENLTVEYWKSDDSWTELGDISGSGWTNFTATGLTNDSYYIHVYDENQTDEGTQTTWSIDGIFLYTYNETGGSNGYNWTNWSNANNPDLGSPWEWTFDCPNETGYYEFYSIGNLSGTPESAPGSADALCHVNYTSGVNNPPTQSGESPVNQSTNIDISVSNVTYVIVTDIDAGDTINATWYHNESDSWWIYGNNNTVSSGVNISQENANFTNTSTTYYWHLNITDGEGNWNNESYNFTTRDTYTPDAPSSFTATAVNRTKIVVTWTDDTETDSTLLEWNDVVDGTWDVGDHTELYNNSGESYSHTSLTPGEDYFYKAWSWNITDNVWGTGSTDDALTDFNLNVTLSFEDPTNSSTGQSLSPTWNVTIEDPEGDWFNWSIECNNTQTDNIDYAYNGSKELSLSSLTYSTTYKVWVNVSDEYDNYTKAWYDFTTSATPDTTTPEIIINFAGNLSDSGGCYWRPPGETVQLTGIWSDGYYTNDSRQTENFTYINITITEPESDLTSVYLNWYNQSDDSWDNDTHSFSNMTGGFWEINTSEHFDVHGGHNYSFNINATSSGGTNWTMWNKTGLNVEGANVRRFVQLNCTPVNISYTPFYLFNLTETIDIVAPDDTCTYDRLHHDQGPDGTATDAGYLLSDTPTDVVDFVFCTVYVGFWFDDDICIQDITVENMYLHFWWGEEWEGYEDSTYVGYKNTREEFCFAGSFPSWCDEYYFTNESIAKSNITYDNGVSSWDSDYHLETKWWDVSDFSRTDNSIYEFVFGISRVGIHYPHIINNRSFNSFILFNVPDNTTLNVSDSDSDSLNDWEELYLTYTNPFLADTDNDGVSDYNENITGSDPNNFTDTTPVSISVDINVSSFDFGTQDTDIIIYTNETEENYFGITNDGSVSIDLKIQATNMINSTYAYEWLLSDTPDTDQYCLACSEDGNSWDDISASATTFYTDLGTSDSISIDLRLKMPTIITKGYTMGCTTTITAIQH